MTTFNIYHNYRVDNEAFHNWMISDMKIQWSVSKPWKRLQLAFECCGVDGYTDWTNTTYKDLPDSCCISVSKGCGTDALGDPSKLKNIYKKGCFVFLKDLFNKQTRVETLNFQLFLCIAFVILIFLSIIMFLCARTRRSLPYIEQVRHEILEEEESIIGNPELEENDEDMTFNGDDNEDEDEIIQAREMENVLENINEDWQENLLEDADNET